MNKDLEFLTRVIDEKSAKILDANDKIWEYAELAFHETKSAALLKSILKEEGFALTEGDAGIPTCFTGTFSYGTGKPVMGILGEYDARLKKAQVPSSSWPAQACSTMSISYTPGTRQQKTPSSAITATPSWAQTSILRVLPPTQAQPHTSEEVPWTPLNS